MTPHYEKQVEIEKKIDDLSETLNHFIRAQQSINELILGKYVGQNHESPQNIEESEKMDEQINEENMNTEQSPEQIFEHPPINNPMPIYAVPLCVNHESAHSPIRNRSISPEKMDSEISVRDFLKSNMTVQKADDKILEMERERDREEEAQLVKYNKFRVRNRPKKYKRSAVTVTKTFTTTTSSSSASDSGTSATPSNSVAPPPPPPPPPPPSQQQQQPQFILEESPRNSAEIHELHEESAFQPVLRSSELELTRMPPVFPTTSSYVLNSSHSAHQTHDLTALTAEKFQTDQNNIWKAVDNVTQLLVDRKLGECSDRLIALGADVNFICPESGDTALHVAAREGNSNQVELLFLYGADLMAQNKDGQLPYITARDAGNTQLYQRIYEFFFYIFDRFSFFMCNRKADHKNNQDFFVPEVTEKQFLIKTKDSRSAISLLPKGQFFDLCEDAFDETVRRENEVNWSMTKWAKTAKGPTNVFLPPTPQMSAARNQRRQKLAKFTPIQFTILLIDLMKDQKRRITGDGPLTSVETHKVARKSNDTPLRIMKKSEYADYDEVAGISCSPISGILPPHSQANTLDESSSRVWDELLEVKERLSTTEGLVLTLTKQNEELTKLIHSLQAQNINLNSELISFRDDLYNLKRTNMTRRMPSPLAIVESPVLPPAGVSQSFPRRLVVQCVATKFVG
uniref:ANK_REP_REGION domain-containing protein n=1 Tax=Caenorhabditis japonica TaxID=281687 RepID=A0A8R1HQ56_CAEJA